MVVQEVEAVARAARVAMKAVMLRECILSDVSLVDVLWFVVCELVFSLLL